jgi:hypothetical protein
MGAIVTGDAALAEVDTDYRMASFVERRRQPLAYVRQGDGGGSSDADAAGARHIGTHLLVTSCLVWDAHAPAARGCRRRCTN